MSTQQEPQQEESTQQEPQQQPTQQEESTQQEPQQQLGPAPLAAGVGTPTPAVAGVGAPTPIVANVGAPTPSLQTLIGGMPMPFSPRGVIVGDTSQTPPPGSPNAGTIVAAGSPSPPDAGTIVAAGPQSPRPASEAPTADLPLGTCFYCSRETRRGRILAHTPVLKIQCADCKRVDQALSRQFGSIQWLRDMPFEEATAFYNSVPPEFNTHVHIPQHISKKRHTSRRTRSALPRSPASAAPGKSCNSWRAKTRQRAATTGH